VLVNFSILEKLLVTLQTARIYGIAMKKVSGWWFAV
jgi:hypothetical protein